MKDEALNSSGLAERMARVGLHEHLCLVHNTRKEQLSSAILFMKAGLESGDKCLYIADTNTVANLSDAMRTQGIDVDAALKQRRLTFATNRKIFPHRKAFEPDEMIAHLTGYVKSAKTAGFRGLRWAGEMTWVTGIDPRPERLIEYEAKLNQFLADHDALVICQYDSTVFQPEVILNVLRTHPTVVYDGAVSRNPFYVSPEEFLSELGGQGEIRRLLGNMQRFSDLEQRLNNSESLLNSFLDNCSNIVFLRDREGRFMLANKKFQEAFNLPHEEIIGRTPDDISPPGFAERYRATDLEVIRTGKPLEFEQASMQSDGLHMGIVQKFPLFDDRGAIYAVGAIATDITERKRHEDEIAILSGRVLMAQDEERRRIAMTLHDSIGQDFIALNMLLEEIHEAVNPKNAKFRKLFSRCKDLAGRCARGVRSLSYMLHPPILDQLGLAEAIRDFVARFKKRTGIQVELKMPQGLGRMAREVELALFRVVQESLTNVHRHSGSRTAKISIRNDSGIVLEINDCGDSSKTLGSLPPFRCGVGILSMQERVKSVGGQFEIESNARGTTVLVKIPGGGPH